MYIFPDPGGSEVCLRPELTIPVCRAYLRQLQAAGNAAKNPPSAKRGFAISARRSPTNRPTTATTGSSIRPAPSSSARRTREAADAEILAAALDALEAAGLKETRDRNRRRRYPQRLHRSASGQRAIEDAHPPDRAAQPERPAHGDCCQIGGAASDAANEFGELASLLAAVEPGKAELLIREVFALADVRHVGGRTPEEIVERLISRTAQQAEPISAELMQGVLRLLNIRAKPEAAFKAIREHFRKFRIGSIERVLERCEKRLRYFNAYRQSRWSCSSMSDCGADLNITPGFCSRFTRRTSPQIGHVCGGGRYDNLLEGLGASESIPAVGFGIGLDRLLPALQNISPARQPRCRRRRR